MWPYNYIAEYIGYIVQRLNISPQGSSVTLVATSDGSVIVNRTQYLSEFYENWNTSTHSNRPTGFSMPIVLSTARDLAENQMDEDRRSGSLGGQSMVALIVPSPVSYVSDVDYRYAMRFVDGLNNTIPDLTFIYYAGGAAIRFMDFVSNPREDLFQLSFNTPVRESAAPVMQRIRRIPRRLVYPRCNAALGRISWGPSELVQRARLGSTNFYRMSSLYFFPRQSMRYLKVQAISKITFTVCTSRTVSLPQRVGTSTPAGVSCGQVAVGDFSYDLTDACDGYDSIRECPPLYVSVQAQGFADITQVSCDTMECQSPDEAQYLIFINNLNCPNGSMGMEEPMKLLVGALLAVVYALKVMIG